MPSTQPSLNIAIVGGGPSGLTLAAILKKIGVQFTVFELDASRDARGQGGMLDVHKRSGQLALKKAGLIDQFRKAMRVDATEIYVRDRKGTVYLHHSEEGEDDPERPEIDRAVLRRILLDALDPDTVRWGKKLKEAEVVTEDGKERAFRLHFADGSAAEGFNIVIGADGTWSKVRRLRSDVRPPYVGITVVATNITPSNPSYPAISDFVGKGSCMAAGGNNIIMSQKNGDGSIRTYAMITTPEEWKDNSGIDWTSQRAALIQFADEFYGDWSDELRALIIECDEGELAFRPLYQFPPGYTFEKDCTGVTLLGDAAHVLTPFTGIGVNVAMNDAYDLASAIEKVASEGLSVDDAFAEYEKDIFARATLNATRTDREQEVYFTGKPMSEVLKGLARAFDGSEI
ncbi:hypothetical protein D9611_012645 [Ephemerocybe angulata]|uniref:FAD-binding domain-containing protein n=2 Tax=Ephemerocybe angulata TaxID=980116 RepID=A0A8H5ET15_9AGAR|nr:hypothetical protein D9611_012645 [Tulosesus angulatus]